jgi:hypothetical protein
MDDENAGSERPAENLISRPPLEADLANLCRELNQIFCFFVVGSPNAARSRRGFDSLGNSFYAFRNL